MGAAGQEHRLRFKTCELCSGINHYCHCLYWARGDNWPMMPTLEKPKPIPAWLVGEKKKKKAKGQWKGRIIVPQGASGRFLRAGDFKLPGHENMLDTHFCIPQKFMQAFDRMKTVDLYTCKWSKQAWTGQIFIRTFCRCIQRD
jgi:hypothetical protein